MAEDNRLLETVTLSSAKALVKALAKDQSLLLLSPPGVGKSDIVRQAAAEAGLECRSLLGTQIAPEDVSGIPRIIGERSVFCPPRVLLPENAKPFCLFLDELPACAPDIQKAFYSLLLERRLGEHPLPPGTWVVAAGNRMEDRALVRSMSSALINRVILLHVRVDAQEWLKWAHHSGIRQDIQDFIRENPSALLRDVPTSPVPFSTPRAWASLSESLNLAQQAGLLNSEILKALTLGRISENDATAFIHFYNSEPLQKLIASFQHEQSLRSETGDNFNHLDPQKAFSIRSARFLLHLRKNGCWIDSKIELIKAFRRVAECNLLEAKLAIEAVQFLSPSELDELASANEQQEHPHT